MYSVAYKALTTLRGWQKYIETRRGRIWNVLIIKNPLPHKAFDGLLTYDTARCSVQPSRYTCDCL
jgi:hypothetical protein